MHPYDIITLGTQQNIGIITKQFLYSVTGFKNEF